MKREPSELDKRAAEGFQELANVSRFFLVTCRFRRILHKADGGIDHTLWPKGVDEFRMHFGSGANYFAGALEYVRLATGWTYPYRSLDVMVLPAGRRKISGGVAMGPGLLDPKSGENRIYWANGEFTLTVFHELVHLFKKGWEEDRVEQQALKLTLGV